MILRISWTTTTPLWLTLLFGGSYTNNHKSSWLLPGVMAVDDVDIDDVMNSTNTTNSTEPPEPNDCDKMEIGSIYFFFLNSVDPDEVGLFPFEDIPGNLELFLTDNAWNGEKFQDDEGTLEFTTPERGIPSLSYFGYGPNIPMGNDWTTIDGSFSLSPDGEHIFLYCYSADGITQRPLTAISYIGDFQPPGLSNYGNNQSALPTELAANNNEGAIILGKNEYWVYAGPSNAEVTELKAAMKDTSNWQGGDGRTEFTESSAPPSSTLLQPWILFSTTGAFFVLNLRL